MSLFIMDGMPFFCLADRVLELFRHIRTYGELDSPKAFIPAPVAIGHEVMLVARRVGTETYRLHPRWKKRKGVNEDAELFVARRDIAVPELKYEGRIRVRPSRG